MQKSNRKELSVQEIAMLFYNSRSERDFSRVYNRLQPGIFYYLRELLPNVDDRNEAVATTFAKVWSKIDQYDPYWNFSTWVYRIARNEALLMHRSRKNTYSFESMSERGINMEGKGGVCYIENGEVDPADALYDLVLEEIHNLPDVYKQVLTMREVEKKKYEDIANELGWNHNTVRTRIRKGREIVRSNVAKRDPQLLKNFQNELWAS